jgi:hypothetical protein
VFHVWKLILLTCKCDHDGGIIGGRFWCSRRPRGEEGLEAPRPAGNCITDALLYVGNVCGTNWISDSARFSIPQYRRLPEPRMRVAHHLGSLNSGGHFMMVWDFLWCRSSWSSSSSAQYAPRPKSARSAHWPLVDSLRWSEISVDTGILAFFLVHKVCS